jgi:molecular chaperone IbpA
MRTTTTITPQTRAFIGFDHLTSLIEKTSQEQKQTIYPPYNSELLAEDQYRITIAVAGFAEHELDIESEKSHLIITGVKAASQATTANQAKRKFLHQGIAQRNFERKFQLADHVKVIGAYVENGLLNIDLARQVPEALKSRKIAINGNSLAAQDKQSMTN